MSLQPNEVKSTHIADGAVIMSKIASLAVGNKQLASSGVTADKLADGAVSAAKIALSAVGNKQLAPAGVTTDKLANNAVTADKVANKQITGAKLADKTITTDKIADGAVTAAQIRDLQVTTDDLKNACVTAPKIGDRQITGAKLVDKSITGQKIGIGAVTASNIGDGQVTVTKIKEGAVTESKIAGGAVTAGKIAGNAVTTVKIANGAVTPEKCSFTPGQGEPGEDGREVELQKSQTHIQWRYAGDAEWTDLVALSELQGEAGSPGSEIELQVTETHIQWRYAEGVWQDLIALADLKGEQGEPGQPGVGMIWRGTWNAQTEYVINDAVLDNINQSSYICVQSNTNNRPSDDEQHTYWNLLCLSKGVIWQGEWAEQSYLPNDIVLDTADGGVYICINPNLNIQLRPSEDTTHLYWTIFVPPAQGTPTESYLPVRHSELNNHGVTLYPIDDTAERDLDELMVEVPLDEDWDILMAINFRADISGPQGTNLYIWLVETEQLMAIDACEIGTYALGDGPLQGSITVGLRLEAGKIYRFKLRYIGMPGIATNMTNVTYSFSYIGTATKQ